MLSSICGKQPFRIIGRDVKNFFTHKCFHSLGVQPLQTVLQGFVCIGSLLILELHLIIFAFCAFVYELADEKSDQPVKRVLFIADIVVPQYLLKSIYDFIIRGELAKLFSEGALSRFDMPCCPQRK